MLQVCLWKLTQSLTTYIYFRVILAFEMNSFFHSVKTYEFIQDNFILLRSEIIRISKTAFHIHTAVRETKAVVSFHTAGIIIAKSID